MMPHIFSKQAAGKSRRTALPNDLIGCYPSVAVPLIDDLREKAGGYKTNDFENSFLSKLCNLLERLGSTLIRLPHLVIIALGVIYNSILTVLEGITHRQSPGGIDDNMAHSSV